VNASEPIPAATDLAAAAVLLVDSAEDARATLAGSSRPVVVIPVYNAYDDVAQCVEAVRRYTPRDADVLVVDDGSTDARIARLWNELPDALPRFVVLRQARNAGFVRTMNVAFEAAGRRDVVILNSDVIVGSEWLTRLRAAAYSDSRVATATPLTNSGSILSVPEHNRGTELPAGLTPDRAARAVAAGSTQLRPVLPTCVGHCTYIKRMALDVVGDFDEAFSPGYGEEVDFSQRCVRAGLSHVCADDVFVYHRGSGSFGLSPAIAQVRADHERELAVRYPLYHSWVDATANRDVSVLASALANARRSLLGMSVAVDATGLGPYPTGTQRVAVETIRLLARHPAIGRVIVVVGDVVSEYLRETLSPLAKIEMVRDEPSLAPAVDVAYRPVQTWCPEDLARMRRWSRRFVVTQLDLIAFNNPAYFPSWDVWATYRDVTRLSLAAASGVAFLSQHSEREAREHGLLADGQLTSVTYCGTDHFTPTSDPRIPAGAPDRLAHIPYVLCLGTDYLHKNRPFALRVFGEMRARGWDGDLVLAGPRMPLGSSRAAEAEWLLRHPELADHVITLADVTESERTWLYGHASLVLHPTLYEGFGLVPFEAGASGVPCLTSTHASLAEILPDSRDVITDWDPAVVARQALELIADGARRQALTTALGRRAREFTWAGVVERLVALFDAACQARPRPIVTAVDGERTHAAPAPVAGAEMFGDGLPPREVLEFLRAIGQRPALRRPLFGTVALTYRLASGVRSLMMRHRGGGEPST